MGISAPENLGKQESSRRTLCTNKVSRLVFYTKQSESPKASKYTLSCLFRVHLLHHTGCRLQFTALSPLRLYTLPGEAAVRASSEAQGPSGQKLYLEDAKMAEWGMKAASLVLLCFCVKCPNHAQWNIFIGTSQGYKTLWLRQMTVLIPVLALEPILPGKSGMDLQKFGR